MMRLSKLKMFAFMAVFAVVGVLVGGIVVNAQTTSVTYTGKFKQNQRSVTYDIATGTGKISARLDSPLRIKVTIASEEGVIVSQVEGSNRVLAENTTEAGNYKITAEALEDIKKPVPYTLKIDYETKLSQQSGPVVTITEPTSDEVSGVVTIKANVKSEVEVQKVDFMVNGEVIGSDTESSYESTWDTTGLSGEQNIVVTAYDTNNRSSKASVTVMAVNQTTGDSDSLEEEDSEDSGSDDSVEDDSDTGGDNGGDAPSLDPTDPDQGGGNDMASCTPGVGSLGHHGTCYDPSQIPAPAAGVSTVRMDSCAPVPTPGSYCSDGVGERSAFRTQCSFSHMNTDDSILFPGQPGAAHLHTYFGNTGANANSTSTSLRSSGNSTCRGGIFNRSAYWAPAMIDSSTGRPIVPNSSRNRLYPDLEVYYKLGYQGVTPDQVRAVPEGLQIIAGFPANATTQYTGWNSPTVYYCETQQNGQRLISAETTYIPRCEAGWVLTMHIKFPQCWDGRNLSSPSGRSHMAYGTWGVGCPSTHPVGLPFVEMLIRYEVLAGENTSLWRLSSDNYTSGPGGYSGHADYIFAWDVTAFPTIVERCHRAQYDCKYQLGDGRFPAF